MLLSRIKNQEHVFGANDYYWHGRGESKDGPVDLLFTDNEIKLAMERAMKMPALRQRKRPFLWFFGRNGG